MQTLVAGKKVESQSASAVAAVEWPTEGNFLALVGALWVVAASRVAAFESYLAFVVE